MFVVVIEARGVCNCLRFAAIASHEAWPVLSGACKIGAFSAPRFFMNAGRPILACFAALIAALLLPALPAQAADPDRLIPRKDIFGNPTRTLPAISPDGRNIAYIAPRDGVLNVFVAPRADIAAAKPVTADKKRGIR